MNISFTSRRWRTDRHGGSDFATSTQQTVESKHILFLECATGNATLGVADPSRPQKGIRFGLAPGQDILEAMRVAGLDLLCIKEKQSSLVINAAAVSSVLTEKEARKLGFGELCDRISDGKSYATVIFFKQSPLMLPLPQHPLALRDGLQRALKSQYTVSLAAV